MKTILIALISILFAKITIAQKELLSFDEHDKYIYYQVVDIPGMPADTLNSRGFYFLKTAYPKIKIKKTLNTLNAEGKFVTFNGSSVLKHENGEIAYQVNIECKDHKYRYWITGFIFTPYQRDRYGNFVPEPGINIPLETALSKFDKKEVDNYLNDAGAFCKQFGDRLKLSMLNANTPKKEETVKKVVTDKW
jgi:hypothetical protein